MLRDKRLLSARALLLPDNATPEDQPQARAAIALSCITISALTMLVSIELHL